MPHRAGIAEGSHAAVQLSSQMQLIKSVPASPQIRACGSVREDPPALSATTCRVMSRRHDRVSARCGSRKQPHTLTVIFFDLAPTQPSRPDTHRLPSTTSPSVSGLCFSLSPLGRQNGWS